MPLGWITGNTAAARNRERVRQEGKAWRKAKEEWRIYEDQREDQYDYQKETYERNLQQAEERTRFEEKGLIQNYQHREDVRRFEYDMANRAYYKSVSQAARQKDFNEMAFDVANYEQDLKLKDDLLGVIFDEAETILEYKSRSTGLKMNQMNALNQADFKDASNKAKMTFDVGSLAIERNQKRSASKIEAQKAIVEGMKAAGALRARGTAGRSSAKSVLGVLAESGAMQAGIANALMYAEQSIDLEVAQLKDMFILDQTMVLAAKDKANNDQFFGQSGLDAGYDIDKLQISATRQSIKQRDDAVRRSIELAREQADLNAEAAILLKPSQLPSAPDPREVYAEYDNPETEDYVELFYRPEKVEFPEFVPSREPTRDDFRGPRENVFMDNLTQGISAASMLAGGIGAFGGSLGLGSLASGQAGNFLGLGAKTWTNVGAWLGGGQSVFGGYAR